MKDQLRLLRDCITNYIPAVVFQGDDSCAPEILEAAMDIYRKHGCSEDSCTIGNSLLTRLRHIRQNAQIG